MNNSDNFPTAGDYEDEVLKTILKGTADQTGEKFFFALVENLAKVLNTSCAWITEYVEEERLLRALAFWVNGKWIHNFEYGIDGTPCEKVIDEACMVHVAEDVIKLYPEDKDLESLSAVSYLGVPLQDINGKVLGNLAIIDTYPMPANPRMLTLLHIFAARAAAEHRRLSVERQIREREQKLIRLINSAMDAITELNSDFIITNINPAAGEAFGTSENKIIGNHLSGFISEESMGKLSLLIEKLKKQPEGKQYLWIPGVVTVKPPSGHAFPAEGTISRFVMNREIFFTIILRDINDRLEANNKIKLLTEETEYLREEIRELQNFDGMIGNSPAWQRVLKEIEQVAQTDSTVLIEGETGTGKGLIAYAIYNASLRKHKQFIKVNCAAVPANLIESEFFGHEKGAFTGAVCRRDGRFLLADGGTIFLDEIGELPVDLQVKFLRVLQEGEFEPIGSSRTIKVDVRIIAATNRNLLNEIKNGVFRADLYYRLNVFPLKVPPLRERPEDIPLLAAFFTEKYSHKMKKPMSKLSSSCIEKLSSFNWPGNVRELENVIERAVINTGEGQVDIDNSLPDTGSYRQKNVSSSSVKQEEHVFTGQEMAEFERKNILLALKKCGWKVAGKKGAAGLLGIPPSTLSSRIRALGIKKPH